MSVRGPRALPALSQASSTLLMGISTLSELLLKLRVGLFLHHAQHHVMPVQPAPSLFFTSPQHIAAPEHCIHCLDEAQAS